MFGILELTFWWDIQGHSKLSCGNLENSLSNPGLDCKWAHPKTYALGPIQPWAGSGFRPSFLLFSPSGCSAVLSDDTSCTKSETVKGRGGLPLTVRWMPQVTHFCFCKMRSHAGESRRPKGTACSLVPSGWANHGSGGARGVSWFASPWLREAWAVDISPCCSVGNRHHGK